MICQSWVYELLVSHLCNLYDQEKQRGLQEREAQAEMQHDEACKELQSLLGDVDAANDSGKQGTGEPWPDENILLQPGTSGTP